MQEIIIIGGGLAGCEAALQIAKRKINVKLYEMKPVKFSDAHSNESSNKCLWTIKRRVKNIRK